MYAPKPRQNLRAASGQRGMSIVELMVGITLGLFVVAAAALMVATQLGENRRMLLESQLMQDLRAASDIITRDLRRASYTTNSRQQGWSPGKLPADWQENSFGAVLTAPGSSLSELQYEYRRRSGDEGPFGFKRDGNVLRSLVAGGWQPLTDERVLKITDFSINFPAPTVIQIPCPRTCDAAGSTACWPEVQVRTATIRITGEATSDAQVQRTLTTEVRLRNDFTKFNGATACPA